ncbi:hypothetical protein A2U01_0024292 [Trifolium medium]|uniref:RNA-directed DNA polymerase (Reverse transcriptase) n=1 Tax=Trifolium medium TaxID=97028 RepID=A0A392NVY0_9FABA|nr:hypothetical protein [Trifolium medium]
MVLKQEEVLWFQKSRSQWIKDGDRNTSYNHLKTLNRRRRNKILMLKNDQGHWEEDVVALQTMVNEFYINLFAGSIVEVQWRQTRYSYPQLDEDEYAHIKKDVTDMEVKDALFANCYGPLEGTRP